jgi:GMP synthase (glutamine-hydrolysing)
VPQPILVLQPAADDPPGRLGDWLVGAGCRLQVVRPVPGNLDDYGGLLVLGGAMGAYDDAAFGWLTSAKALLADATRRDLPTLAICLGHQLLAVANAGVVTRADTPQIGVVDLRLTAAAASDPLFGPLGSSAPGARPRAVHFNNDLVTQPPAGAVALSTSAAGMQALRLGTRVWGVQFHPEVDPTTVRGWAEEEVAAGRLSRADADLAVGQVSGADPELEPTWQAFTQRFAAQVCRG